MENQLVIFELNNESFGVDISSVESIIKMQEITRMPQAPAFVEGITHLRGKVLPVIDMRKRFGLPPQAANKDSRIIVVNIDEKGVGMVVDGVSEVLTITDMAVEPAPSITTTVDSSFIKGVAKLSDRLVILLDLGKILSDKEQKSLKNIAG